VGIDAQKCHVHSRKQMQRQLEKLHEEVFLKRRPPATLVASADRPRGVLFAAQAKA
jgi:hypothetical protein